ncbi:hypothetical protein GF358_01535 [Candidatus Woesearchaeota archaeon]|nr:hypothetical protein [Candidatus Woesearchaeota archaeon]
MLREIYLSVILAIAAGITIYGISTVPTAIFDASLKGLIFSLGLFIAGLHFLKNLTA